MFRSGLLALVIAVGLSASTAMAYRAINLYEVNQVDRNTFEVVLRPGAGPADVWCAAGDYARRVLGLPSNARLYITVGRTGSVTRPGYKGVRFSPVPPPGTDPDAPRPWSLDLRRVGDYLRVVEAWMYCTNPWERNP